MSRKRPRSSRRGSEGSSDTSARGASDLMVVVPKGSQIKVQLQVKEIIDRLASTGFTQMALVHTIYGRPKPTEDRAEVALPSSLWGSTHNKIRILRRLHVVLENQSDVGIYVINGTSESLLNEYDLISLSPRNESTFQAACTSASAADIITLDYTTRGVRLPYRIRQSDTKAVIARKAAFEIPLAPALLCTTQRKALVQTCRELQKSCLGVKPDILVSSGDRSFEESDVGTMAFRMPGDIKNLMQTVLQFDDDIAGKAVRSCSFAVVKRAQDRRFGKSDVTAVAVQNKDDFTSTVAKTDEEDKSPTKMAKQAVDGNELGDSGSDDEAIEDGFIAM